MLGLRLDSSLPLALEQPLGRSGEGVKVSSLARELLLAAAFPIRGCWAEVCWYVCNAAPASPEHPAPREPSRHGLPSRLLWHPVMGLGVREKPGAGGDRSETI